MRFNRTTMLNLSLTLTLLGGLLAGCSSESAVSEVKEETTIKVMYYSESSFYQQYGMLFSAIYPEVKVEVVSTQSMYNGEVIDMKKAMKDFIAEQKPDVLMLSTEEYRVMAAEGKLYNLEAFIKEDNYDLEGIIPGIVDYIKQQSDGILYGLSPTFQSQAIYYNKDLFAKHGVTLPEDKMSWEQLLQLAERFPTGGTKEERIYGLKMGYNMSLFDFGINIGNSMGLSYVDSTTMQMMINTDSWKRAFGAADRAIKSGALYTEDQNTMMSDNTTYEHYLLRDPFISGKVAMSIDYNYTLNQLNEAKDVLKDKGVQNWDLVTVPVNPQIPDESSGMMINQIFSIDAQSANAEAAWKFISYINGDEFARVTSKVQNGGFPARTKYLANDDGRNMAAFYRLKPSQSDMYKDFEKLPQDFFTRFYGITQVEFQGVTDGKVTISEALDSIQEKGQQILLEEKNKGGEEEKAEPRPEVADQSIQGAVSSTASVIK